MDVDASLIASLLQLSCPLASDPVQERLSLSKAAKGLYGRGFLVRPRESEGLRGEDESLLWLPHDLHGVIPVAVDSA